MVNRTKQKTTKNKEPEQKEKSKEKTKDELDNDYAFSVINSVSKQDVIEALEKMAEREIQIKNDSKVCVDDDMRKICMFNIAIISWVIDFIRSNPE